MIGGDLIGVGDQVPECLCLYPDGQPAGLDDGRPSLRQRLAGGGQVRVLDATARSAHGTPRRIERRERLARVRDPMRNDAVLPLAAAPDGAAAAR
jgi:hypothetical protein